METQIKQLSQIEKETEKEFRELKLIINDLYPKGALAMKMFRDEIYIEIIDYVWGSEQYIKKLNKLVNHYEFAKTFWYNQFNVQEAIDNYNHYGCGVFMREAEKKRVLNYAYFVWMLNMVSGELKNIIVANN